MNISNAIIIAIFKHPWCSRICLSLNITWVIMLLFLPRAMCTKSIYSHYEEAIKCFHLKLNTFHSWFTERCLEYCLCFLKTNSFLLVYQFPIWVSYCCFMLIIISLFSFPHGRKGQLSIKTLPKSQWAFWRNKTGQHWARVQRRSLHIRRSQRGLWKSWKNCKYTGNLKHVHRIAYILM